jgi:ABC-type bacteriocin/lantibiotic exporter with double-glycine peptidase domain
LDIVKRAEEIVDPDSVVLDGFRRSLQLDAYSCGAQSCYMILRYYGKARSAMGVERALGTTLDGTTEQQIRALCRRRGVKSRLLPPTMSAIRAQIDKGRPILVSVDGNQDGHWAVIYGYSPRIGVYLADPSLKRSVACLHSFEEFRGRWDRWAMTFY